MAYPVRYSTRAFTEYEEILDYVANEFGIQSATKVDIYFEEVYRPDCNKPFSLSIF